MTAQQELHQTSTLIAIDIAKHFHDVLIQRPDGQKSMLKISNNQSGFQTLLDQIGSGENVIIGFEPTADFHRNIAYWFSQRNCICHLVSSLACARAREMLYHTWDKHDRKDATVILYLLQQGMSHLFYDPLVENIMDIQEVSNTYHQISLARSRCYHSLINHYLTLYFPEIERYYHNSRSEWFCHFMLRFSTPSMITKYKKQTFVKQAWKVVGRKVNKQLFLEELYELSEQSIGLPVSPKSMAVKTFKMQLQRFLELTQQRKELEELSETMLNDREDYQHLRSLPGVGPIIALIILAESGNLKRFSHYRQYLNFCGFNLSSLQSGRTQGQYHLSKRGNARLRYAFWLAANSAIKMTENSFRQKYQRYIKKDPDNPDLKRKARTAVASKMARVAHALVKNNQDYRGYHEFGYGT